MEKHRPENIKFRYPEGADEEKKQEIRDEALYYLDERYTVEKIPALNKELPIETWQQGIISKVDQEVHKYFQEILDLEVPPIDQSKVHLLSTEEFEQAFGDIAAIARGRHIFFPENVSDALQPKLRFTRHLIHEYLHSLEFFLFSENIITNTDGSQDKEIAPERQGTSIEKGGKRRPLDQHFKGLDEGITMFMEEVILHRVVSNDPDFQGELDDKFALVDQKVGREELFRQWGVRAYDVEDVKVGKDGLMTTYNWKLSGTYIEEQDLIIFLARKIARNDPAKFPTANSAVELLFKAQYRGELLPLVQAVDSALGKGATRLVAAVPLSKRGDSNQIAQDVLKYLRLPPQDRDPEFAKEHFFVGDATGFEKYMKQVNKDQPVEE